MNKVLFIAKTFIWLTFDIMFLCAAIIMSLAVYYKLSIISKLVGIPAGILTAVVLYKAKSVPLEWITMLLWGAPIHSIKEFNYVYNRDFKGGISDDK